MSCADVQAVFAITCSAASCCSDCRFCCPRCASAVAQLAGCRNNATKEHDKQAMQYLSYALFPLVMGYATYALVYQTHKSWYSFVINSLVGAVYTFGFILMCPQVPARLQMTLLEALDAPACTISGSACGQCCTAGSCACVVCVVGVPYHMHVQSAKPVRKPLASNRLLRITSAAASAAAIVLASKLRCLKFTDGCQPCTKAATLLLV